MIRDSASDRVERIGRYRILRRVSSGGMGVVYFGVAEGIGGFLRPAAIKMLNPEHRDRLQYIAMFLDEARIGARVQHPNLVSVQEIGEHEGELFIAMDYVHGETLAKIIQRHDNRGGSFRSRSSPRSVSRSRTRSMRCIAPASSTATSHRRTSSSVTTGSCA